MKRWRYALVVLPLVVSLRPPLRADAEPDPGGELSGKRDGKNPAEAVVAAGGERKTARAGDLREDFGYSGFVFYLLPEAEANPVEVFEELAKAAFSGIAVEKLGAEDRWDPERPMVGYLTEPAPLKNFPAPAGDQLRHLVRGVTEEEAAALGETSGAFVVRLAYPQTDLWNKLRAADGLAVAFAEKTGALIWDSTTRELFSADSYRKWRNDKWPADVEVPDIRPQITIHAYKKEGGDFCRAVTLGMRKFGLPDLVLEDFTWADNRGAGNLVNLVGQRLVETGGFAKPEDETLAVADVENAQSRESFEGEMIEGAAGSAQVEILEGRWEEGDAANRLLEIGFSHYPGKNVQLRQARLFDALFGSKDSVVGVRHDKEILAASERAKGMLPVLRRSVENGLPPGAHLMFKAPFARDDEGGGDEWMWVEVIRWEEGKKVRGILRNEPFHVKGLHAGMEVVIDEDKIFDYLLRKPDGTFEGNETGKLIREKAEKAEGAEAL